MTDIEVIRLLRSMSVAAVQEDIERACLTPGEYKARDCNECAYTDTCPVTDDMTEFFKKVECYNHKLTMRETTK